MALPADVCRICHFDGTPDEPLFYPCNCRGTMGFIHQHCLNSWIDYSRIERCDICRHPFSFTPIYSPDMTVKSLTLDVIYSIITSLAVKVKNLLQLTCVTLVWFMVLPIGIHRFDQCVFNLSLNAITHQWTVNDLIADMIYGIEIIYFSLFCVCTHFIFVQIMIFFLRVLFKTIITEPSDDGTDEQDMELIENFFISSIIRLQNLDWNSFFGYDVSLTCLRKMSLVLCVNGVLTLMFTTVPYCFGQIFFPTAASRDKIDYKTTELLGIKCGFYLLGLFISIISRYVGAFDLNCFKQVSGILHSLAKVLTSLIVRNLVLPSMCGWWLDVCSLSLFNNSFEDRLANYHLARNVIHWLVGMVFISNCDSFTCAILKVVRPNILWFMNPRMSCILNAYRHSCLDTLSHGQLLLKSAIGYVAGGFLVTWIPIQIIKFVWPSLLPYHNVPHGSNSSQSIDLLLLYAVMPSLEITMNTKWVRVGVRYWCVAVSRLLGIKTDFLRDGVDCVRHVPLLHGHFGEFIINRFGLAEREVCQESPPSARPTYWPLRLIAFFSLSALSLVIISVSVIIIPVWVGRLTMLFWTNYISSNSKTYFPHLIEINTVITASMLIKYSMLAINILMRLRTRDLHDLHNNIVSIAVTNIPRIKRIFKVIFIFFAIFGMISLLFGLLHTIIVIVPFDVPDNKTPLICLLNAWQIGLIQTILFFGITLIGPNSNLKRLIHQCLKDIIDEKSDCKFIMHHLVIPITVFLSLCLAVPYVLINLLITLFIRNDHSTRMWVIRTIYPTLVFLMINCYHSIKVIDMVTKFVEKIKNEKYLTDRIPINLDR